MSKELPYYRFTVSEWLNDDISLESYELKGVFSDICAFYWFKDCIMDLTTLKKRFSDAIAMIDELISLGIIKLEDDEETIVIKFLNEQYDLLSDKRQKRVDAGRKGGLTKASNAKAKLKQSSSYKDNNKDKENYNSFIDLFNQITGRKFRGSDKVARQFNARTKEGYTLEDFFTAITNANKDEYLKKNPQYLTLEYITRADQLDKWLNVKAKPIKDETRSMDVMYSGIIVGLDQVPVDKDFHLDWLDMRGNKMPEWFKEKLRSINIKV